MLFLWKQDWLYKNVSIYIVFCITPNLGRIFEYPSPVWIMKTHIKKTDTCKFLPFFVYSRIYTWMIKRFPWFREFTPPLEKYPLFHENEYEHGPLARYAKLRVRMRRECRERFPPSPQVSDPDMHHGTCGTHVLWCMPGSLTIGFLWNWRQGKTFPAFPAHAQPAILRIW